MDSKTNSQTAAALATLFGVGRAPIASGTVASIAALPLAFVIHYVAGAWVLFACAIAAAALGIWACDIYARESGIKDPSECVIDELAGQWLACAFAPLSLYGYALAFLLFRIFDVAKPWPISAAERQPGGLGIMLDDVIAGLFAGLLVALVRYAGLV
jgi:phosphatidylglycerophosphatase A